MFSLVDYPSSLVTIELWPKMEIVERSANPVQYDIVPDERDFVSQRLMEWADAGTLDLVITTGGTGLAERDVTPEAALAIIDRFLSLDQPRL